MTPLNKLKDSIGWRRLPDTCSNCKHFSSEKTERKSAFGVGTYIDEKGIKCDRYGFATKKSAVCDNHEKTEKQ